MRNRCESGDVGLVPDPIAMEHAFLQSSGMAQWYTLAKKVSDVGTFACHPVHYAHRTQLTVRFKG